MQSISGQVKARRRIRRTAFLTGAALTLLLAASPSAMACHTLAHCAQEAAEQEVGELQSQIEMLKQQAGEEVERKRTEIEQQVGELQAQVEAIKAQAEYEAGQIGTAVDDVISGRETVGDMDHPAEIRDTATVSIATASFANPFGGTAPFTVRLESDGSWSASGPVLCKKNGDVRGYLNDRGGVVGGSMTAQGGLGDQPYVEVSGVVVTPTQAKARITAFDTYCPDSYYRVYVLDVEIVGSEQQPFFGSGNVGAGPFERGVEYRGEAKVRFGAGAGFEGTTNFSSPTGGSIKTTLVANL